MKLFVTVKPGSKVNEVERIDDSHFRIRVKAAPTEGRANEAVVRVLADYFGVPKSRVKVLSGGKSRNKVIGIL